MNETCDFCQLIFKNADLSSEKYAKRASYCPKTCSGKKNEPRYMHVITPECQKFMKGVFEAYVATGERGTTIFNVKTFDALHTHLQNFHKYISDAEYNDIFELLQIYEEKYGKYVDLVLNQTKFMEVNSSSGPKPIKTPDDWASAITNLNRILDLANQGIDIKLESFLNKKAVESRKKNCKKLSKSQCTHPCVLESGAIGKTCSYRGNTKYNK